MDVQATPDGFVKLVPSTPGADRPMRLRLSVDEATEMLDAGFPAKLQAAITAATTTADAVLDKKIAAAEAALAALQTEKSNKAKP